MIVRHALLLAAALTLGSCCLSGNCYAPITGTAGVAAEAPDGLGSVPTDEPQAEAAPAKPAGGDTKPAPAKPAAKAEKK